MRVSYNAWMNDPFKWLKRTMDYHDDLRATRERFDMWAHTPEGKARIKEYLLKHGYTLDGNSLGK